MRIARLSFLAAAAIACASAITHPATATESAGIVVYNAQHEALTQEWIDGFTKATGISVTLRNGDDMEFANQLVQEGTATPADVFLTENSPAMALVDRAGMFEPLAQDILDQVPAAFRPADGKWIGIAARSTVFAYDKTKLRDGQLPKTMDELADPKWKGRWSASPAGADFQAVVAGYMQMKGKDAARAWLSAMKQNAKFYKGNTTCMKAVNAGQVEGALIFHYYYFGDQAKTGENSKNVGLHFFKHQDAGAFVSLSGGGVLAASKHKAEAAAFLKWVTGKNGQDVLKNGESFEYAIGRNAASNPKLPPLSDLDAPKVEPADLDNKAVTDLMTEVGIF